MRVSTFLIFALLFSVLSAGCASLVEQSVQSSFKYVEDSLRGYRLNFHSMPPGARVSCKGEDYGVAPLEKYFTLTEQQKREKIFQLEDCRAVWGSGAFADIGGTISLEQFPRFVNVVSERPINATGYEVDDQHGETVILERKNNLEAVNRAADSILAFGFVLRDARKSNQAAITYTPDYGRSFQAKGAEGIRWNWVTPTSLPSLPKIRTPSSRFNYTPVVPASSCFGSIVNGKCHGSIIDSGPAHYCSGKIIDGRCIGSILIGK